MKRFNWDWQRNNLGLTGGMAEDSILGLVVNAMGFQDFKAKGVYMKFREALNFVKSHQPAAPTNPEKRFARDLRSAVAQILNAKNEALKFFTAVGSPLDFYHGVDGFITYQHPTCGEIFATMDVKTYQPEQGCKANVLIVYPSDDLDIDHNAQDLQAWNKIIETAARELVAVIRREIQSREWKQKRATQPRRSTTGKIQPSFLIEEGRLQYV